MYSMTHLDKARILLDRYTIAGVWSPFHSCSIGTKHRKDLG